MKIVVDIQSDPKDGQVIVYDKSAKKWRAVNPSQLLISTEKRIDEIEEKEAEDIAKLEAKLLKLTEQINTLAKAMA